MRAFTVIIAFISFSFSLLGYEAGKTSVGSYIGFTMSSFDITLGNDSGQGDPTGFAYGFDGNLNLFDAGFGMDINSHWKQSPSMDDEVNGVSYDVSSGIFHFSVRPFFTFGNDSGQSIKPYIILGVNHTALDVDREGIDVYKDESKTSFTYGLGASVRFHENFFFNPHLIVSKATAPSLDFGGFGTYGIGDTSYHQIVLPFIFQFSDSFSFGAELSHTILNKIDMSFPTISWYGSSFNYASLGYEMTTFMAKGSYVF